MEEILQATKPMYNLAKVFGLVPFHGPEDANFQGGESLFLDYLYNPIFIISISATYAAQFIFLHKELIFEMYPLFHEHAAIVFSIFVLVMAQLKRKTLTEAADLFQEVDMKMKMLDIDLNYPLIHRVSKYLVILNLVVLVAFQLPVRYVECSKVLLEC